MKKIISLVAVFAILAVSSFSAFAADFETAGVEDITATAVEGVYTVQTPEITADYATILAVKGDVIQVGAIQYINQASTAEGAPSFEFALNPDLLTKATTAGITDTKVYVLTGGDGVIRVAGYIQTAEPTDPEVPEVKYFTITGTVSGFAGAILPTVVVTDGETNYTATVDPETKAFSVSVPELAEGSYTLTATKTSHLSYTKANITAETTVNPVVKAGDINDDKTANVFDIGVIVVNYNAEAGSELNNYVLAHDLNEDSTVNVFDIGVVVVNYNAEPISE